MPQFQQIDTFVGQIFWLIICFGILYLGMRYHIIPRLTRLMERRRIKIDVMLNDAASARAEAEEKQREIDAKVMQTRQQANAVLQQAQAEIAANEQEALARLNAQLEKKFAAAQARLIEQQDQIKAEMADLVTSSCTALAEQLVAGKLDAKVVQMAVLRTNSNSNNN